MDEPPDTILSWDEIIASWRTPIRVVAGLGLLLALIVIVVRTLNARDTVPAIEAYIAGTFFAVIAASVSLALFSITSSSD